MSSKYRLTAAALAALTMTMPLAAPAFAQSHWVPGHWDWSGGRDNDTAAYALRGPGVQDLYPELRDSRRGRAFVLRNFDARHDGWIGFAEARAANRAFEDSVGPDHGRFDWAVADRGPAPRASWDRVAMRGYGFRDTAEGARLTLSEDVLFRTASADLRPGALDKLQTLADYLRDHPGVRVSIDGYTDSRGSDAYNQALSERRAASVRAALGQLGVTEARFRVRGHGEANPVAPNDTPQNMHQNRRVEITLLGQRASALG